MTISWEDFEKVELRVGTIVEAKEFPQARKPAYQLKVDFGEMGVRQSSAQVTDLYQPQDLVGKQVVCVTNFEPKRIAGFKSEILVTGFVQSDGKVVLVSPDQPVKNGLPLR